MTRRYNPYGRFPPYQKHSRTSKAAALSMDGKHLSQRERVYAYVREQGLHGATREEICTGLGLSIQAVTARVVELLNETDPAKARLIRSGEERETRSGRMAEVLIIYAPTTHEQGTLFKLEVEAVRYHA